MTTHTAGLDVVYLVRRGDTNIELRHSLRSVAAHLDHNAVFVAGHKPPWVRAPWLKTEQQTEAGAKYANTRLNLRAALRAELLTEDVVIMNDDFYVMAPVSTIDTMHRGDLAELIQLNGTAGSYWQAQQDTLELLHHAGYDRPLAFNVHAPIVVNRRHLADVLDMIDELALEMDLDAQRAAAISWRTMYGNIVTGASQRVHVQDFKILDTLAGWDGREYVSTDDQMFRSGAIGHELRAMFVAPCTYERIT